MTKPTRVLLVRHAPTSSTRRAAFPADEELDARGRVEAATLRGTLPRVTALTSPARRASETATLAGFREATVEPALAECGFGRWSGRTFREVQHDDPDHFAAWLADPEACPPGGESIGRLVSRVAGLLESLRSGPPTLSFTHGGPIKAAIVYALEAPMAAVWRVDVAPCSVTELHSRREGGWTLARMNVPAAAFVTAGRVSA
ncbi:MAG: histidine phosphatase family protein [Actinomycetota bacterium]|nr:histidine phosphatase family protein [Actinomycetota bacterium]